MLKECLKGNFNDILFKSVYESGLYPELLTEILAMKDKENILEYNSFLIKKSDEMNKSKSKFIILI